MTQKRLFWLLLVGSLASCAQKSYVFSEKKFAKTLDANARYTNSFHGVCVYDLGKQAYILNYNADKYFTPASNTKLYTFYAGLKLLPAKIPALQYTVRQDSLIFWGTGDPSLLHPVLKNQLAYQFLKSVPQKLFFSASNFRDERFGDGWAWNDYNSSYQPEKSPLPIYGNTAKFKVQAGKVTVMPRTFAANMVVQPQMAYGVDRDMATNRFVVNPQKLTSEEEMPFVTSPELLAKLLTDTLGRPVGVVARSLPPANQLTTLPGLDADSLYREMLQVSDNFLAEHILLLCAGQIPEQGFGLNTRKTIEYVNRNLLKDLTSPPRWVDGSGLSRYNLFTPRSYVELLRKIYAEVATSPQGETRLFGLLPQPGVSGTLANVKVYPPTLYAKTGSLSNNHNLSGYLVTKSGKRLVFSFQNNHFMLPVAQVREEMGKVLTELYERY
jgi:D-alanyl-D-alanine carboxypeptidase/D-alanyl-D-alanine-endopeptidase (penicillin-binding protein 4)